METTVLGLMLVHPSLGFAMCAASVVLGYLGYLSCKRVCLMMERVLPPKGVKVEDEGEVEEVPPLDESVTCSRCNAVTGVDRRHEIYCSLNQDNVDELKSALKSLGYKEHEISKVLPKLDLGCELPVLIKQALAEMPNRARAS